MPLYEKTDHAPTKNKASAWYDLWSLAYVTGHLCSQCSGVYFILAWRPSDFELTYNLLICHQYFDEQNIFKAQCREGGNFTKTLCDIQCQNVEVHLRLLSKFPAQSDAPPSNKITLLLFPHTASSQAGSSFLWKAVINLSLYTACSSPNSK